MSSKFETVSTVTSNRDSESMLHGGEAGPLTILKTEQFDEDINTT